VRLDGLRTGDLARYLADVGIKVDSKSNEIDGASLRSSRYGALLEETAARSGGRVTWSIVEDPELTTAYQRELSLRMAESFAARATKWTETQQLYGKRVSQLRSLLRDLATMIAGVSSHGTEELYAVLVGAAQLSKLAKPARELAAIEKSVDRYRAAWAEKFGEEKAMSVFARVESELNPTHAWRSEIFEAESTLSTSGRYRTGRELMKKYFVGETFTGALKPWIQGDDRYYVINEAAITSVGCLDFATAEALYKRNLEAFKDAASHIATNHNLAEVYLHTGDFDRMEKVSRKALALAENEENLGAIRDSLILLGTARARAGKNANKIFERAMDLDAKEPATDIWGVMLADHMIGRGLYDQANAHLGPNPSPAVQAVIERAKGDLALAMGAKDEASVRYESALATARSLGDEALHVLVDIENAYAAFRRTHANGSVGLAHLET
jgi:tetratricopeptide (TPR) repeat protein